MYSVKFLLATTLSFTSFIVSAQQNEYIDWSAERQLTWKDYEAVSDPFSDAAATTSTALGIEYNLRNNSLTHKVICRFSRTKSWGRYKTEYILSHEQGHFDITEIFARKLHKSMNEYQFNVRSYRIDVSHIYDKILKEKEEFQKQYDYETDYSRNKQKQEEWLKKIERLLDEYEAYALYN